MTQRSVTAEPRYAKPDYRDRYDKGCVEEERSGRLWYVGRGVHQSRHPLGHRFGDLECKNCGIEYATVIAASASATPAEGEAELICEFRCDGCGMYNQVENSGSFPSSGSAA